MLTANTSFANYGPIVSFEKPERVCPKCGPHRMGALTIFIDGLLDDDGNPVSGEYCLRCFARWVKLNLPRLS